MSKNNSNANTNPRTQVEIEIGRGTKRKTLILVKALFLFIAVPGWSMVDFSDSDNYPWSITTDQGPDAVVNGFFINLGITGARAKVTEANKRALIVTYVFANTPAAGKLRKGDRIVGANGKAFLTDLKNGYGMTQFGGEGPYMDFGNALEASQGGNGILTLNVKRSGKKITVKLNIGTKYGKYGSTFPYDDAKTDLILRELYPFIAGKQQTDGTWGAYHVTFFAAMALLSSGDAQYLPKVKKAAQWFASHTTNSIANEMFNLDGWKYSFAGILLSEYYLATKESWVIPELVEIKTWLLQAQFTDMSQQVLDTHGPARENQLGGWGHNPHYEGYGPFHAMTGQAMIALCLMKRCGIAVDQTRMLLGYKNMSFGIGANGYAWYADEVGGGPNDWADMGRTGTLAIAHYLAPFTDAKYKERAALHAHCIGYDGRFKSFPDTHASPHVGMIWAAMGAHLDKQGYMNLMGYHRWWFSLAQAHDGNQFVDQPNRDAGGSYDDNTRVASSAVIALVMGAKNKTLQISGYEKTGYSMQQVPSANSAAELISFSPREVEFALQHEGPYEISIYDMRGSLRHFSGYGNIGRNLAPVNGLDLPQGVYSIKLSTGGKTVAKTFGVLQRD